MTAWLVYSVIVGAFLAVAALGAEGLLKSARRPVRAVWFVAIALTIAVTVSAPWRSEPAAAIDLSQYVSVEQAPVIAARTPTLLDRVNTLGATMVQTVMLPLKRATDLAASVPTSVNRGVQSMALAAAVIALIVLLTVYARSMQERIKWPLMHLLGKRVRVTPNVGPAVLGLAPPEIVVPRWVLLRKVEEQRLVLEHESEHVRANDPLLLMFACIAVALMPWNAALWFMWSRLRLAVELDCDRRVLLRGVPKPAYGQLLVELSSNRPWMSPAIPAFSWGTSHLEQRLVAMTARPQRFRLLRRVASGSVIATALLAATTAEMPAPAVLQAMEASHLIQGASDSTTYFFRGKEVTKDSAHALMRAQFVDLEILKRKSNPLTQKSAGTEWHIALSDEQGTDVLRKYRNDNPLAVDSLMSTKQLVRRLRLSGVGSGSSDKAPAGRLSISMEPGVRPDAVNAELASLSERQDTIPRKKVAPKVVVKKPVPRKKVVTDSVPRIVYKVVPTDSVRRVTRKVRPGMVVDTIEFAKRVRLAADSLLAIELIRSGRIATEREPVRYIYGKNLVVKDSATGMVIVTDSLEMRGDSIVTFKADSRIRIRGQSSLSSNSGPLIILNGVIFNGETGDIDPKSIDHIEVIKGAAATALYGVRAANGAIRITTKR